MYTEPIHDNTARTTATSKAEGRLRMDVSGMRRKRKKKNSWVREAVGSRMGPRNGSGPNQSCVKKMK